MKIQIDTEAKTIKLEGQVNLSEFVEKVEKLFPDGAWKEYKLETNTVIHNWANPIVIRDYPVWPYRHYPYWQVQSQAYQQSQQILRNPSPAGNALNPLANTTFNIEA